MKRLTLVLLLALATPAAAQNDPKQAPTVVSEPEKVGIGKTYTDAALTKARAD
ncbi:hypothetical protein HY251_05625 [bacterium]|nr:hypothetical protein [bacterium]